jgi:hypothetical protein
LMEWFSVAEKLPPIAVDAMLTNKGLAETR